MKLPVIDAKTVRDAIEAAHAQSGKCFSCEECMHLGTEDDGEQGGVVVCTFRSYMTDAPGFPFKMAPSCFVLDTDVSPYAELLFHNVTLKKYGATGAAGVFALARCADSSGRLRQIDITEELHAAIYGAMFDPIEWVQDEDGDLQSAWRELTATIYPGRMAIPPTDSAFAFGISWDNTDVFDSADPDDSQSDYCIESVERAVRCAEIEMREAVIRRLLAEGK